MKKENKELAKQRRAQERRKKKQRKKVLIVGGIILAVLVVIGAAVGIKIADENAKAPVTRTLSKYVTKEGKIKGIDIDDYVELCDLKEVLTFAGADVYPTDAEVSAQMQSGLSAYEELKTGKGTLLKDGDKVNIDYVGYVDGVAFDGGNTNGGGADLTLGSGTYIDDFEDQLVGCKVGDEVTVEVTFPETYSTNPDLAGKNATFEVVINGVYFVEITDARVAENIDGCVTVEEYREQVRQSLYESNLSNEIWNVLSSQSTIKDYPEDYTNNLMTVNAYYYQMQYTYANESAYSYYEYYPYDSIEDYYGMTMEELEQTIAYYTSLDASFSMLCQAIYEKEGLSVTEHDKQDFIVSLGYDAGDMETAVNDYGANYIMQGALNIAANNYVESIAVVTE